MQTKVISHAEVVAIVNAHKVSGKVFGVKFVKKDNSDRVMSCRFGVQSYLQTAGTPSTTAHIPKYITVFDMHKQAYRNVNLDTLIHIVSQQVKHLLL